jgi:pimeloyl-ACP methyl ester carboxylesterase
LFLFTSLVLVIFISIPLNSTVEALDNIHCQQYTQNVKLSPLDLFPTNTLSGTLCYKGSINNKTLQYLIHGMTYSSYYWDFTYQPEIYSYVRYATESGYATFNVDRIGSGNSSRPNGSLVDFETSAYTLHQSIQALRNGSLTGHSFNKVIVVGHSLGTTVGIHLVSLYQNDADGFIASGSLHNFNATNFQKLSGDFYQASSDPKFQNSPNADTYLTTVPGKRGELFYNLIVADPNVIAVDETQKDVISLGFFPEMERILSPESLAINIPVMVIVGAEDGVFCGGLVDCHNSTAVAANETLFYSPSAHLETYVVPDSGHDLNLHPNAPYTYGLMKDWSNRYVGVN